MLSIGCVLSCWAPLRMCLFATPKGHNGPRAIYYEVGANCAVLLIVLYFVGRRGVDASFGAEVFALLRVYFGLKTRTFTRRKSSARHARGASTPPKNLPPLPPVRALCSSDLLLYNTFHGATTAASACFMGYVPACGNVHSGFAHTRPPPPPQWLCLQQIHGVLVLPAFPVQIPLLLLWHTARSLSSSQEPCLKPGTFRSHADLGFDCAKKAVGRVGRLAVLHNPWIASCSTGPCSAI